MAIPGLGACFHCNDPQHWAEACWTRNPPSCKDHHEARIVMYRDWGDPDRMRVDIHQKRQLIEHECKMWAAMQPAKRRAS